jgi:hypothetical protein
VSETVPNTAATPEWEARVAALWATLDDDTDGHAFVAAMDELAAELPEDDPVALFERAGARDSVAFEESAEPLYRRALAIGLPGDLRRRAVIQLASTLRNIGGAEESVRLLTAEREAASDELDDAVACTLALALTTVGREVEAVSVAVGALAKHLPRYQRSMTNYARLLVEPDEA